MNRWIYFVAVFLLMLPIGVYSQVGIGTEFPLGGSVLEIRSEGKGLLMPRMSAVSRLGIGSPAEGLLLYQLDGGSGFRYYDGLSWRSLFGGLGLRVVHISSDAGGFAVAYSDGGTTVVGISRGLRGSRGGLRFDYRGLTGDRSVYDGSPLGTTFLDVDSGKVYFRVSLPYGNGWSRGISVGRGDAGVAGDAGSAGVSGRLGYRGLQGFRGIRGYRGLAFTPNVMGVRSARDDYGDQGYPFTMSSKGVPEGFSYYAEDSRELFFVDTVGVWGVGIPFGRGFRGGVGRRGVRGSRGVRGARGDRGEALSIYNVGSYSERRLHAGKPRGFGHYAVDSGKLYFRLGDRGWSVGYPFGQGDRGGAFAIDAKGSVVARSGYAGELTGFTYYATDVEEVSFLRSGGLWGIWVPMPRAVGVSFAVDATGLYGSLGRYSSQEEGFTYYAVDSGKVYFRDLVSRSGWTAGLLHLRKGRALEIDGVGLGSFRSAEGLRLYGTYLSEDVGMLSFSEGGSGWSRGYYWGPYYGRFWRASMAVGNAWNLPQSRDVRGYLGLDAWGRLLFSDDVLKLGDYGSLGVAWGLSSSLWDGVGWRYAAVGSYYRYGLVSSVDVYYDGVRGRFGQGHSFSEQCV